MNSYILPHPCPTFRFLERQFSVTVGGTRSPWTPQRTNEAKQKPPNPPARLSPLHSSRLLSLTAPGERLRAPCHINHSALACLTPCTSRWTQLHVMLLIPGVKWDVCKIYIATLRDAWVSVHMRALMIWFQSEVRLRPHYVTVLDNSFVFRKYFFSHEGETAFNSDPGSNCILFHGYSKSGSRMIFIVSTLRYNGISYWLLSHRKINEK